MKHRIIPLTIVVFCLGLPSLAIAKSGEAGPPAGAPRGEVRHESLPGARPFHIGDRPYYDRYHEHLDREYELDRARRREAIRDEVRWERERELRAEAHRRAVEMQWDRVSDAHAARVELGIHADRMARLNRALDLSEEAGDEAMRLRIHALIGRENVRHARRMAEIRGDL
jgi:hypothetical protein